MKKQEILTSVDIVKRSRKAIGITQADLAILCDVTEKSISNWERGRREPRYVMLQYIARLANDAEATRSALANIKRMQKGAMG